VGVVLTQSMPRALVEVSSRALGARVVDLNQPIIEIAWKRAPARERIADRHRGIGLGGQCGELLLQLAMEIIN